MVTHAIKVNLGGNCYQFNYAGIFFIIFVNISILGWDSGGILWAEIINIDTDLMALSNYLKCAMG